MDFIEITIKDFKKIVKRSDIKAPQWFAVEHNLLLHPDFFDLTGDEVKAYLWIVGTATHLNVPTIRAYGDLCCQQIRISKKSFLSSVRKLTGKRWDVTIANESVRNLPSDFEPLCTTGHNITLHNTTLQDSTGQGLTKVSGNRLICLWNEHRNKLPKVEVESPKRLKASRALLGKYGEEALIAAIQRVANSDFCNGLGSTGWVLDFDFFIKPDTFPKIIEGKYDNRTTPDQVFQNAANAKWANS